MCSLSPPREDTRESGCSHARKRASTKKLTTPSTLTWDFQPQNCENPGHPVGGILSQQPELTHSCGQ